MLLLPQTKYVMYRNKFLIDTHTHKHIKICGRKRWRHEKLFNFKLNVSIRIVWYAGLYLYVCERERETTFPFSDSTSLNRVHCRYISHNHLVHVLYKDTEHPILQWNRKKIDLLTSPYFIQINTFVFKMTSLHFK